MSSVAIAHPELSGGGGAERVSLTIIGALQRDHDVTILTLNPPEWDEATEHFGVDLQPDNLTIRRPGPMTRSLYEGILRRAPGSRLAWQSLFARFIKGCSADYDIVVSSYNEYPINGINVQYIHHPNFYPERIPDSPQFGRAYHAYAATCRTVSGILTYSFANSTVLANSDWTAELFRDIYGTSPGILYPPVDTAGFEGAAWEDRENGFVIIGRVAPDKYTKRAIQIVDELVKDGYETHLHVVGGAADPSYYQSVQQLASDREYVVLEGRCSRSELIRLVGKHRYGLHAKPYEHFGIAVAELVAGGTIPFVPDGGGQREIVGNDALVFESIDEAVERIEPVLSSPTRQAELRESLPDIESKFGVERFQREFRELVANALETKS